LSTPVFTLIAGPNGSGKSSLTAGNRDFFSSYPLLDPDALAKTVQVDALHSSHIAAGREVLNRIEEHLTHRKSIAVETTLSGKNYLQTMQRARDLGFMVHLLYICTSDVDLNLIRVQRRFIGGGHNVPENDIRRRYIRSLQNLVVAAHIAHYAVIFDNSTRHGYREICTIHRGISQWFEPIPAWALPLQASFTK
jgi:predicted ABC-type ATPase